jgi:hypothetical protein
MSGQNFRKLRDIIEKEMQILTEKNIITQKLTELYATKSLSDIDRRVEELRLIERFMQIDEQMEECNRRRLENGFQVFAETISAEVPALCPIADTLLTSPQDTGFEEELQAAMAPKLVQRKRLFEEVRMPEVAKKKETAPVVADEELSSGETEDEDSFISDDLSEEESESISESEEDEPKRRRLRKREDSEDEDNGTKRVLRNREKCTKLSLPVDCVKEALKGNFMHLNRLMDAKIFYLSQVSSFGYTGKDQIATFHKFVCEAKLGNVELCNIQEFSGKCLMCKRQKNLSFSVCNTETGKIFGYVGSTCSARMEVTLSAGRYFSELVALAQNHPFPLENLDSMLQRYLNLEAQALERVGCK